MLDELANALLGHHIQPDRWLVQIYNLRVVQQRGHQLAAHTLAQR